MNLKTQRAASLTAAQEIVTKAKAEDRDLTAEEIAEVEAKQAEIKDLDEKIERHQKSAALVNSLAQSNSEPAPDEGDQKATIKNGGVGRAFVKSEGFKAFRSAHPSGVGTGTPVQINAKGLGSVRDLGIGKKDITTDTGVPFVERDPGYQDRTPVEQPLTFLDLITVGQTTAAHQEYAQIVAVENEAAIVAEGGLKPLSSLETSTGTSTAFTYADGFVVTNQSLSDDGALAAFMESRIAQHVRGVIESYLLNGEGGGSEPEGILNTTGTLSQSFDFDVTTTLARAMDTFEEANGNAAPQAIVMHPSDVWDLRLLKDADGNYQLGNPLQQGPIPTPWGVPLVSSRRVAQGTALVGRFDSVHYLELEALEVLAFNQHENFAQLNKVYVRAESRGRQLFYVPREVVVATIANGGSEG